MSGQKNGIRGALGIAFAEGAGVMILEAMTAKYLSPIYGDTLHVWGTAVGLTLVSLTVGYFLGGRFAERLSAHLHLLLLMVGSYLALTPFIAAYLIEVVITGDLLTDCLIIGVACLGPPLVSLGMVPSILVQICSQEDGDAGQLSGKIFGFSTLGGIVAIFLTGFWLVPSYGVTLPMMGAGASLVLIGAVPLLRRRTWMALMGPAALLFAGALYGRQSFPQDGPLQLVYYSEGILGQVMVGDFEYERRKGDFHMGRALYVNRMPQTLIDLETQQPLYSPYIQQIMLATEPLVPQSQVLLLGLGGGNLVKSFVGASHRVDVVELDQRVIDASREYFFLKPYDKVTRYFAMDARHYLRTCEDRYGMIVFDIFKGENPPHHAFTVEAFREAKSLLAPNGFVLVNFLGRTSGERSLGARAVIRTIREAGFATMVISIPNIDNVIVIGAQDLSPWASNPVASHRVPLEALNLEEAPLLTDDRPILEVLHLETAQWNRQWYNEHYTYKFMEADIPLFR